MVAVQIFSSAFVLLMISNESLELSIDKSQVRLSTNYVQNVTTNASTKRNFEFMSIYMNRLLQTCI
jgi:hypothetical protein